MLKQKMIKSLNHITLAVCDIEESFAFYRDILDCQPIAKWPAGAYLLIGDIWLALVEDEHARSTPPPDYSHLAFTISAEQFKLFQARFIAKKVTMWQDNWTEGNSLYFCDPNGHKLELHVGDLASRLKSAKANPWPGLEFFGE